MNKRSIGARKIFFGALVLAIAEKSYAACPNITPLESNAFKQDAVAAASVFKYYIKPVFDVVKVGVDAVRFNPASIAKAEASLLIEVYGNHARLVRNSGEIANLIDTIRGNYRGTQATFKNLTTDVALNMLGQAGAQDLKTTLSGTTLCVGGRPPNYSQFEISFYGLKQEECQKMTTSVAARGMAERIEVNQIENLECLSDHIGKGRSKYKLFSFYGRNQVTFIVGR